jgi:hypothetical protein
MSPPLLDFSADRGKLKYIGFARFGCISADFAQKQKPKKSNYTILAFSNIFLSKFSNLALVKRSIPHCPRALVEKKECCTTARPLTKKKRWSNIAVSVQIRKTNTSDPRPRKGCSGKKNRGYA